MTTDASPQSPVSLFADPDLLLTTAQLAATLQIDERTLRNRRSRGEGPPWLGPSGFVRYRAAAVVAWMSGDDRGEAQAHARHLRRHRYRRARARPVEGRRPLQDDDRQDDAHHSDGQLGEEAIAKVKAKAPGGAPPPPKVDLSPASTLGELTLAWLDSRDAQREADVRAKDEGATTAQTLSRYRGDVERYVVGGFGDLARVQRGEPSARHGHASSD